MGEKISGLRLDHLEQRALSRGTLYTASSPDGPLSLKYVGNNVFTIVTSKSSNPNEVKLYVSLEGRILALDLVASGPSKLSFNSASWGDQGELASNYLIGDRGILPVSTMDLLLKYPSMDTDHLQRINNASHGLLRTARNQMGSRHELSVWLNKGNSLPNPGALEHSDYALRWGDRILGSLVIVPLPHSERDRQLGRLAASCLSWLLMGGADHQVPQLLGNETESILLALPSGLQFEPRVLERRGRRHSLQLLWDVEERFYLITS